PLDTRCTPTDPVVHVAASQPNVAWLVVDDLNVYFVDNLAGTVMSVPKAGGPTTTLASNQNHPRRIAVDGLYLYVLNAGTGTDGEIIRMQTDGKGLTVLATGLVRPAELLTTTTHIYWTNGGLSTGMGSVMRIAK